MAIETASQRERPVAAQHPDIVKRLSDEWYPRAAKIGKGRTLALEGPLRQIIERRLKVRRLD